MPSTYMTEGFLKPVLDFIAYGAKGAKAGSAAISKQKHGSINARSNGTAFNMSSIASATRDLTMSFPVLCSDTITPQTASIITKAIERNNVSMLQMLIAAYHITANNGVEAIKMVHTNMDNAFRSEDLIDAVVGAGKGIYEMGEITSCKRPPINYAKLLEEAHVEFLNSIGVKYPESSFSENSIADYTVTNRFDDITVLKEATKKTYDQSEIEKDIKSFEKNKKFYSDSMNKYGKDSKQMNDNVRDLINWQNRKQDLEYKAQRDNLEDEKDVLRSRRELFLRQLLDSDVKKANEVQPTLLVVPFYYEDSTGAEKTHEFIAGVKSRLIVVTSEEIIDQIIRFNKQGVNLNNLIRATTKEISFSKEFIGGIEQAKIDAKRDSKLSKTSPIWRMLQSRSSRSGLKTLIRTKDSKNAAAAITSLVITAQEAEYIAENSGIDITNPAIAREFMSNYNLLCLIIVDEQTEVAKFLYDGEKYFTEYSFSSLDRDNNSNDTRKLISLLNKTR